MMKKTAKSKKDTPKAKATASKSGMPKDLAGIVGSYKKGGVVKRKSC